METKAELVLHQYGDRELFYAEAEDGSWQLPLFVEWRHDKENDQHYSHIVPAGICLYHNQALALVALLGFHDILGKANQWVIPRRICEALLHKAPGITPRRYYRWPGDDPPIETKPPLRTKMRGQNHGSTGKGKTRVPSFVGWLAKETKIASSIINAVLNAVAEEAPTWLLEHRKPLDLGFCRLVAVPFRANWKEIIAFKGKAQNLKLRRLFQLPDAQRWEALEEIGFPAIMTSPHNVGLCRGWKNEADVARIDYTIEAIPSDSFNSAANRIEGKRMARGAAAYVAEFEDAVEAVYQTATEALRSYLRKAAFPYATVGNGGESGRISFEPVIGRKVEVRGTPLSNLPVHVQESGSRFSVYGLQSDKFLISPPTPEVPAVSNLLQAPPDVRERSVNGDLVLLDGGEGVDRMHVLDGDQGNSAGQSLLAEPTSAGDGLDDKGDWPVI